MVEPSLRAAGEWALRFGAFPHVRVGGLVRGRCWVVLEGREPVLLHEGDTFMLGNPPPYVLASTPDVRPRPAESVWATAEDGVVRIGPESEEDLYLCVGHLAFDDRNACLLTDLLPPLVIVRAADPRGGQLGQLIEMLATEVEATAAGGPLVQNHLAQVLLVHMLRAHACQTDEPIGWLGALNQDGIGVALRAMHADVGHSWTVGELAAISELASATGYSSESAFSTAFRRVVGSSPKTFRDEARTSVAS